MSSSSAASASAAAAPAATAEKQWYYGACHCHAVEYKVQLADLYTPGAQNTIHCNCSICTKNGYVLLYPRRDELVWLRGEDTLRAYQFATRTRDHRFCPACGSSILIDYSRLPKRANVLGINARMLKGIDVDRLIAVAIKGDGRHQISPQFNEETA